MSLLPGTSISVGLLILPLGFSMPVEGKFSKQVSFMGTGISAGCLISYLGFRLPVEGGFLNSCLGVSLSVGKTLC